MSDLLILQTTIKVTSSGFIFRLGLPTSYRLFSWLTQGGGQR